MRSAALQFGRLVEQRFGQILNVGSLADFGRDDIIGQLHLNRRATRAFQVQRPCPLHSSELPHGSIDSIRRSVAS